MGMLTVEVAKHQHLRGNFTLSTFFHSHIYFHSGDEFAAGLRKTRNLLPF